MAVPMDETLKFLAVHGVEVRMHSIKCGLWLEVHPNCRDCPYELGCMKYNVLSRLPRRTPLQLRIDIAEAKSVERVTKLNPLKEGGR